MAGLVWVWDTERYTVTNWGYSEFSSTARALTTAIQPALFMTVRREIAKPRRETGARSPDAPMRTRAVR